MMDVRRIKQRNEHIDVEESDHQRLGFVPEPIYDLRCDESGTSPRRQNRHAITLACRSTLRRQGAAGEFGKHARGGGPTPGRELLCRFQYVLVDVQRGSHGL